MSIDSPVTRLRLDEWDRPVDDHECTVLALCVGPTLDVGCGPGRLTAALAERGHVALGIDVVGSAVGQTRQRGASALRRDVFDEVPGEGRWQTALLADGNVGIGGDPVALLQRLREVLDPRGRVVVELAPPGTECTDDWARLEYGDGRARVLPWSVVSVDDIEPIAGRAGLSVVERLEADRRWWVVLEETEGQDT
ncbi:methyltransferase domain-containing protein [Nocardioides sp. CN2-186]|uniref:class I SAM-dependent methyltransferase n=1 Tax=Nocardioides tweenelious TaxID=3156607 RepID=UPI0032B40067